MLSARRARQTEPVASGGGRSRVCTARAGSADWRLDHLRHSTHPRRHDAPRPLDLRGAGVHDLVRPLLDGRVELAGHFREPRARSGDHWPHAYLPGTSPCRARTRCERRGCERRRTNTSSSITRIASDPPAPPPISQAKVVPLHLADGNMTCRKNSYVHSRGRVGGLKNNCHAGHPRSAHSHARHPSTGTCAAWAT